MSFITTGSCPAEEMCCSLGEVLVLAMGRRRRAGRRPIHWWFALLQVGAEANGLGGSSGSLRGDGDGEVV